MDGGAGPDAVVYRLIHRSRNVTSEQERRAELGRLFTAARVHDNGISPAAPQGDGTADQEAVLQVMREAARGRQPV